MGRNTATLLRQYQEACDKVRVGMIMIKIAQSIAQNVLGIGSHHKIIDS